MIWYVLYVRGGKEEQIVRHLRKEGLAAFVPKVEKIHKKQGVSFKVEKVLFPNYIFVESELNSIDFNVKLSEVKMKRFFQAKNLQYDLEGTSALSEEEQLMLERLLGKNKVVRHSTGIIEGDRIIILDGPLKGFESSIKKIDRHQRKAIIEVDVSSHPLQASVSLEIISKI